MWPWRNWRTVARVGDVASRTTIAIDLDGTELLLGFVDGRYFAMQRRCPHRGADLTTAMLSRGEVICPQHGWRFSTTSGRVVHQPAYCAFTYRVRVVGDEIQIDPKPKTGSSPAD